MADRQHPLAPLAADAPDSDAVRLSALPFAARFILRGAAPPGTAMNRATATGAGTLLMLGPDEWLLIAPDGTPCPDGAIDISHRNAAIAIAGPFAVPTLNGFVALDLDEAAFPVGMCTRTLLGKAEIVLWRTEAEEFRLEITRSFAPYVWACLEEGRREFL